jgi:hypothetical protein
LNPSTPRGDCLVGCACRSLFKLGHSGTGKYGMRMCIDKSREDNATTDINDFAIDVLN